MEAKLLIPEEHITFVYKYLLSVNRLDSNYSINRLSHLLENNPLLLRETFSFVEYLSTGMESFIIEELEDHLDLINDSKLENENIHFEIIVKNNDVNYFLETIKKSHKSYYSFISDDHIKKALVSNPKAFMSLKSDELKSDVFYRNQLMQHIQYQLVGQTEPAPCARNSTKQSYFNLFKDLPKVR